MNSNKMTILIDENDEIKYFQLSMSSSESLPSKKEKSLSYTTSKSLSWLSIKNQKPSLVSSALCCLAHNEYICKSN